jgi:hypothetical protein
LNCSSAIDLMGSALEGTIAVAARPEFDEHIDACRPCRTYLTQLTWTVQSLGHVPRPPAANPRRADLVNHFRRHSRRDEP